MRPVPHTSRLERTCTKSLRFVAVGCGNDFECRDGDDGDGGGGGGWRGVRGGGWIKDMREASSEFDSVIAQTSETVTRGVSFLPQRRLPRAGAVFFLHLSLSLSPSVTQSPAKNSAVHSLHGPNWVTFTKVYKIHL